MAKITPEIVVSNLAESQQFYEAVGFVKDHEGVLDEHGLQWVSLEMGGAHLWLLREDVSDSFRGDAPRGSGAHLFLTVNDLEDLYYRVSKAGYKMNIVKDIETLWYGLREFRLNDPDGYLWIVNQPVDENAAQSIDESAGDSGS